MNLHCLMLCATVSQGDLTNIKEVRSLILHDICLCNNLCNVNLCNMMIITTVRGVLGVDYWLLIQSLEESWYAAKI